MGIINERKNNAPHTFLFGEKEKGHDLSYPGE